MSDYNLTLFEACEILNRSKKSISRYIRRDLLSPKKVKSQQGTLEYRFSKADIKAFKQKENERRQDRQDTQDRTDKKQEVKNTTPPIKEKPEKTLNKSVSDKTGHGRPDKTEETGQKKAKETSDTTKEGKKTLNKGQTEETGRGNELATLLKETTGVLKSQLKVKDDQIKDLGGKIDQLIERDRETNVLLKGLQEKVLMLDQPDQTRQDKENKRGFWQGIFNNKV